MKKMLLCFITMISLQLATSATMAMSLPPASPCEPTRQTDSMEISCQEHGLYLHILISTYRPDPKFCYGLANHTIQTAVVTTSDANGKVRSILEIENGAFGYKTSPAGDAEFWSLKYGLELKYCVTPSHGGFSVSN